MKFSRTEVPDVILCKPEVYSDLRGYFVETFRQDKLADFLGYTPNFCQDNESKSSLGVLRGLHYQLPPFAQAKLVRVISGRVLDVAVDIRKNSPTFSKHVAIELGGDDKQQLFVPRGFAHGFKVLSDEVIFAYKVDNYYDRSSEHGIAFDDPDLNIDWRLEEFEVLLSNRDKNNPGFKNNKFLF